MHLKLAISELEKEGAKVFQLKGLSPSAIVLTKDNKVKILEVVGRHFKKSHNDYGGRWKENNKLKQYLLLNFDAVIIRSFDFPKKEKKP